MFYIIITHVTVIYCRSQSALIVMTTEGPIWPQHISLQFLEILIGCWKNVNLWILLTQILEKGAVPHKRRLKSINSYRRKKQNLVLD